MIQRALQSKSFMAIPVLREKDFADRPRFQLWTDALCFREMAKQAANNYLSSMSVRNAVLSAWTTLEMACCDAFGLVQLPDVRFKEGLKIALANAAKAPIDFGSGLWQRVLSVQDLRNIYSHAGLKLGDHFPPLTVAENAIVTIRAAVNDMYLRMGKAAPRWVDFDQSNGWTGGPGSGALGHLTLARGQLDQNAPDTLRIALVTADEQEKVTDFFPGSTPESDVLEQVEDLLGRLNVSFIAVRVYRGPELLYEEDLDARG